MIAAKNDQFILELVYGKTPAQLENAAFSRALSCNCGSFCAAFSGPVLAFPGATNLTDSRAQPGDAHAGCNDDDSPTPTCSNGDSSNFCVLRDRDGDAEGGSARGDFCE